LGRVRSDARVPDRARARCRGFGQGVPHDRGDPRRARGGPLMAVHVVRGDDPILRGDALDALLRDLVGDDDRSLSVEEVTVPGRTGDGESDGADGRSAVVAAAVNAAQCPPFMTARRVVVLRDVGNLGAADAAPLVACVTDPIETTDLVFV